MNVLAVHYKDVGVARQSMTICNCMLFGLCMSESASPPGPDGHGPAVIGQTGCCTRLSTAYAEFMHMLNSVRT